MPKELPLAGVKQSAEQIAEWVEQFHREGYLLVKNVLPLDWCVQLRPIWTGRWRTIRMD